MQGTMPGSRRRGRPRTAWMDNIKTWTGLSVEESVRMTEDGESMPTVWPTLGSRTAKEQKEENYYYHRHLVFFSLSRIAPNGREKRYAHNPVW